MDNKGGTDVDTKTLFVGNDSPDGVLHDHAEPGTRGADGHVQRRRLERPRRHDHEVRVGPRRQRHVTRPTRGPTPTTSRTYANAGTVNVGLRVTDDDGATGTTTRSLGVKSASYSRTRARDAGPAELLAHGRAFGPDLRRLPRARARPPPPAAARPRRARARSPATTNTAARFDGVDGSAQANRRPLCATTVTVEFWLKWNAYANDDA